MLAKNQFDPPCCSKDIAKIWKIILGTLGIPDYTHPQLKCQLVEDFSVYLRAKNKLHHSLLSWDIHFKESCNLIGWEHFGPQLQAQNFNRYGPDGEIRITILVFPLDYSQEKLMTITIFKKSKNPILGSFWALFSWIWQKSIFLEK